MTHSAGWMIAMVGFTVRRRVPGVRATRRAVALGWGRRGGGDSQSVRPAHFTSLHFIRASLFCAFRHSLGPRAWLAWACSGGYSAPPWRRRRLATSIGALVHTHSHSGGETGIIWGPHMMIIMIIVLNKIGQFLAAGGSPSRQTAAKQTAAMVLWRSFAGPLSSDTSPVGRGGAGRGGGRGAVCPSPQIPDGRAPRAPGQDRLEESVSQRFFYSCSSCGS